MTHLRAAEGICSRRHVTWELGPPTNIKRRQLLATQQIRHSDVAQFYAVFCKLDRISDLSVAGFLRFLYLSLQISSHECDKRTNEGFDAYLKTRHVGGVRW